MFLEYLDGSLGLRDIRANNHIRDRTWISADKTVKMSIDSTHQEVASSKTKSLHTCRQCQISPSSANVEVPTVSAILVGPFNRSPTERQMPPLQRLRTGQGGPS